MVEEPGGGVQRLWEPANARLICAKIADLHYWEGHWARLKQYRANSPTLDIGGETVYFLINTPPGKIFDAPQGEVTVGLEVLGYEALGDGGPYYVQDLERGFYYGLERPLQLAPCPWSEILSRAEQMARELAGQGGGLGPVWQIRGGGDGFAEWVDIRFFPEL